MTRNKQVSIFIDGKKVLAQESETILDVAHRAGIHIPTLCHHKALSSVGACRLCVVQISNSTRNMRPQIVTSCLYPVEDGLEVVTSNEKIKRSRQTVLELLLARSPNSEVLHALAVQNGVSVASYKRGADGSKCIMCYLCVRACESMGCNAISTVGRGVDKKIAMPFHENSEDCVGCGSCAFVCPTKHITIEDTDDERLIWNKVFVFEKCDLCQAPFMTRAYKTYAIEKKGLAENYYEMCAECKKKTLAKRFSKVGL